MSIKGENYFCRRPTGNIHNLYSKHRYGIFPPILNLKPFSGFIKTEIKMSSAFPLCHISYTKFSVLFSTTVSAYWTQKASMTKIGE